MKNIQDRFKEKLNVWEKVGYFKSMWWVFLALFIVFNIVLFYFLNGVIYFIWLIIWNVVFVWIAIPVAIFIGKTYLIDAGMELVSEAKEEVASFMEGDGNKKREEKVVKVVKKDEKWKV